MGRDNFVAPTANGSKRPPVPDILGAVLGDTGQPTQVEIKAIKTDGGTQMRAAINWETVHEYRDAINDGAKLPPPVVFFDGADYWLGDGFHRVAAWKLVSAKPNAANEYEYYPPTIPCEVRAGTRRDAVLCAAGANANHGLRRTNQDKRRAVETLLRDEEWATWSDGEIARRCGVSDRFVSSVRKELSPNGSEMAQRTVTRGGTTYTQNTANIGSKPPVYLFAKPFELDRIVESVMRNNWDLATMNLDDVAEMRKAYNTPGSIFRRDVEAEIAKAKLSFKEETLLESFRNVIGFRAQIIKDHGPLQLKPAAVLNTPPAAPEAPAVNKYGGEYQTVGDLVEEIKTLVKPHYTGTGLNRLQIADDMRQNSNAREGEFWTMACLQTAKFRPLDMALAISQVAYQVSIWGVDFDSAMAHLSMAFGGAPVVTLDELPVVDSVTASWPDEPALADPDEEIASPLDCYEDTETPPAAVKRMNDLYELKMWLRQTAGEKMRLFGKLTGRDTDTLACERELLRLADILDDEMYTLGQKAVTNANQ